MESEVSQMRADLCSISAGDVGCHVHFVNIRALLYSLCLNRWFVPVNDICSQRQINCF